MAIAAFAITATAQSKLTGEDCIYVKDNAAISECARNSCARAVRASLPLPTTVTFPKQTSHSGSPDPITTEVRVSGVVRYQIDAGPFVENTYECHVERNMVLEMRVFKRHVSAKEKVLANEKFRVSEMEATKAIEMAYPGILKNAYFVGPTDSTLGSNVEGFAIKGEKVWHVRVHCDKGGVYATFFVHPQSGAIHSIMKPGEEDSIKCG